jgi:rsbT antagonist protein RsbS
MAEFLTPIIRFHGNLIVPIHGTISDASISALQEQVTHRIATDRVHGLVIDVSALSYMDSFVTRVVRDIALIARLMGVHTVLSGLSAEIATTLVEMGLEITGVVTTLNLERAVELLAEKREEEALELGLEQVPVD